MRSHKWRAKGSIPRPAYSVKARRVHVVEATNSKSGVYAIPSTIQLTFIPTSCVSCGNNGNMQINYALFRILSIIAQCHCPTTVVYN